MTNTISIRCINNKVFQEINYINIDELNEKLINIINTNDMYIQLILNNIKLNINLNRFDNTLILTKLNKDDYITIICIEKKELYCLRNENGKYIIGCKNDTYNKILQRMNWYYTSNVSEFKNIIVYNHLVLLSIKHNLDIKHNMENSNCLCIKKGREFVKECNFAKGCYDKSY